MEKHKLSDHGKYFFTKNKEMIFSDNESELQVERDHCLKNMSIMRITSLGVVTESGDLYCYKCKVCEALTYENQWGNQIELEEQGLCFSCYHWYTQSEFDKIDPDHAVIIRTRDNKIEHYRISPDSKRGFQGFGGREFTIHFKDGRIVTTHNLWFQGEIPKFWIPEFSLNVKEITGMRLNRDQENSECFPVGSIEE
ncbi:MAG: hypothetical protein NUV97_00595 [archaeon]|nr:hypothetical protein [archaeon]